MVKNILHTIETTGPGGAETVFLGLIHNLDKKRYLPHVVLRGEGWVYNEVMKSGIYAHIIRSKGSFDIKFLFALRRFIRENKIDIIHSHLFGSNVYSSILGIITGIPVISTFHGMVDIDFEDRFLHLKCMIINRGSKKLVFVSDHLRKALFERMPLNQDKAIVIYNGIDPAKFMGKKNDSIRKKLGYSADDILIGSIGNIRNAKGYDVLIKAAAILKNLYPRCRFIIAGEGFGELYERLINMRAELGVEETVNFLGFRSDVNNILKSLDIFLLPSTTEGFSISTVEAMAAGVPVIVTNSGGPTEIVTNNEDGFVIDPGNPEAIANAIQKCTSCGKTMEELAKEAAIKVNKSFFINKMIDSYTSLYGEVLL